MYPFAETVAREGCSWKMRVEHRYRRPNDGLAPPRRTAERGHRGEEQRLRRHY